MAIGFGPTKGVGATDKIVGPTEVLPAQFSFHIWTNRNGDGLGTGGRIFERNSNLITLMNNHPNTANTYAFGDLSGGGKPQWNWTRPSAGAWVPLGLSVDTSSASNDPIVYQAGSKLIVGAGLTQVRADSAYVTASSAWNFGNLAAGTRNWDGSLAEMAWWDVILTDDEFYALQKGISPDQIRPESLKHYFPSVRSGAINKFGAPGIVTGTAAQDHPRVFLPHRRNIRTRTLTVVSGEHHLISSNSTQSNTADTPAIAQAQALAGDVSTQGNASDTAFVGQTHVLVIAASTQVGASTAIAITQVHVVAGANSTQGNSCGAGATSIGGDFIGVPSTQINQAGTGQITRLQALIGAHPVQANLSAAGAISDGIVVEAALTTGTVETIRIKKPGIPAGTPEWLKTLLEIVIGRRGNAIGVPGFKTLTFSATPTKAECEALYSYLNDVRTSVENILARLDS